MLISLCVLAYKRPDLLAKTLGGIKATADVPYQLIVNLDGGDETNQEYLFSMLKANGISSLILNAGKNRGVGRSFQNCLGLCEGEIIYKIDTDLTFREKWMSTSTNILLRNPEVGSVSLFNYRNYDPVDTRFEILEERSDHLLVNDYVSSIYCFRAKDLPKIMPVADDGNHTKLPKLAITKEDYCQNWGFGVGKSVYVSGTMEHPYKTPTFKEPLIL
jgi:glycosyltransferase involved in cell wall biosynthesis